MLQDHHVAVAALLPGECDRPVAGRAYRRAHRGRVIDATMRAPGLQDRMEARIREPRGDARNFHRRTEESAPQRGAIRGVIVLAAVDVAKEEGLMSLPAIVEFGRD